MNAFLTSIGYQVWVLPVLLAIPLLGAIAIWAHGAFGGRTVGASPEAVSAEGTTAATEVTDPRVRVDEVVTGVAATPRVLALITFTVEFIVSLGLWWTFNPAATRWQFFFDVHWIPSWGTRFTVGLDGIALMMVLLTTFIMVLASLGSWTYIRTPMHS